MLVASISAICAGVMVKTMAWHPEVNSLVVPIVIAFIVGYVVASGFYATFSTTVNTLLLCFCEGKLKTLLNIFRFETRKVLKKQKFYINFVYFKYIKIAESMMVLKAGRILWVAL